MPETHAEEHLRLHRDLYLRRRSRSQPAPSVKETEAPRETPSSEEEATSELDEFASIKRAEKLTLLLAFTLMIYSFYIVVSITPSTIGSILGGGAILMAICSGVNIVRRGRI